MSQAGALSSGGGGGGSGVQTLTGNTGGAVSPTANNINIVGAAPITVTGNPGTSTLTISSGNAAAFSAFASANIPNVTGDGTEYQVVFDTTSLDTASSFNTSTGVYTFPFTGLWLLSGTLFIFNATSSNDTLACTLVGSPNNYTQIFMNPSSIIQASTELIMPFSTLLQITASSTLAVVVLVGGSTKTVGIGGGSFGMTFSGVLLNT